MNKHLSPEHWFQRTYQALKQLWLNVFWTKPDNLWALKVTLSIAVLLIPCMIAGEPFVGCTLALGSVGASLAETDDHPRGRLRSIAVVLTGFVVITLGVEALTPYPWAFGAGLCIATFVLALLGGMGPRYNCITFGVLLVSIYAMLGVGIRPWYYQPVLLPLGALMYSGLSWFLLHLRPYRLLKEQLAVAYRQLAAYLDIKAHLFPCDHTNHKRIRTALAEQNIAVGKGIDGVKNVLYACLEAMAGDSLEPLSPLYAKWMLLQQLHERAASSHQRYDVLSRRSTHPDLVEGLGLLLSEVAKALRLYADTIFTEEPFVLPNSLKWMKEAVGKQLDMSRDDPEYTSMAMLYHNVSRMAELLDISSRNTVSVHIPLEHIPYKPAPVRNRLSTLLNFNHPRFRHAVRLTLCLGLSYLLVQVFSIPKGAWMLLTVLFVCQQGYVATRQRLVQRIAGTMVGVVGGTLLTYLLPTREGQMVLLLGSVFTFFYWVRKRYSYSVAFVTMFVIAAFNLQTGTGVAVMEYRLLCTCLGALLAFAAVRYVLPDWQYRHLPALMVQATDKTLRYFHTIYATDVRGETYYHNRRAAHKADNQLAQAWKCMLLEPNTSRSMLRKAYSLTYLHHALLSYISALGAHGYNNTLTETEMVQCRDVAHMIEQVKEHFSKTEQSHDRQADYLWAKAWCARAEKELKNDENPHAVIIFNIAKVATELLKT